MEFSTERLLIRELSLADMEKIHILHSFREIDEFNTIGIPETIQTTEALLNEWITQQKSIPRMSYIFSIIHIQSNEFIGLIALNLGKVSFKNAEIWYKIHPSYWRQGFATEALTKILDYGFYELHLHRIEAGVAVENIPSIKMLEKVGMIKEGRKRQFLPIRGMWVDNYFYSILDTDFIKA